MSVPRGDRDDGQSFLITSDRQAASPLFEELLSALGARSPVRVMSASHVDSDGFPASPMPTQTVFLDCLETAAALKPQGLRGAVLVPAADAALALCDPLLQRFVASRFAVFDRDLHNRLQGLDLQSAHFELWPKMRRCAQKAASTPATPGLEAVVHTRQHRALDDAHVAQAVCRALAIETLAVVVIDGPTQSREILRVGPARQPANGSVARSREFATFWIAVDDDGFSTCAAAAMARGEVVVAPKGSAAARLICHLVSGIVYHKDHLERLPQLSPQHVAQLCEGAAARAFWGASQWQTDRARLISFVLGDGQRWPNTDVSAHFGNAIQRAARARLLRASGTKATF